MSIGALSDWALRAQSSLLNFKNDGGLSFKKTLSIPLYPSLISAPNLDFLKYDVEIKIQIFHVASREDID